MSGAQSPAHDKDVVFSRAITCRRSACASSILTVAISIPPLSARLQIIHDPGKDSSGPWRLPSLAPFLLMTMVPASGITLSKKA
jgi:hypothetical protein